MEATSKIKAWIKEQVPMLTVLYENKYVGMAYDRFGSLPPQQQRRLIFTFVGIVFGIVTLYLGINYYSLWSVTSRSKDAVSMGALLQNYQKVQRDKSQEIQGFERNAALSNPGQLRQRLLDIGRTTGISPKMMDAKERDEASARTEESKPSTELKIKQASVSLQKVNLTQLVNYLKNVESGDFNLNVSALKIKKDAQMRGYMNVELEVIATIFAAEET
jgi:hypothetical protein